MRTEGAVERGVTEGVDAAGGRGDPVALAGRGRCDTDHRPVRQSDRTAGHGGGAEVEGPALGGDQRVAVHGRGGRAGRSGGERQGDHVPRAPTNRAEGTQRARRAFRFARTGDAATLSVTSWDTNRSSRGCLTAARTPSSLGVFLSGEAELFLTKKQTGGVVSMNVRPSFPAPLCLEQLRRNGGSLVQLNLVVHLGLYGMRAYAPNREHFVGAS